MSERVISVLIFLCLAPRLYAQGGVEFDNLAADAPDTISTTPGTFNPANGPAGAYVGSDYTASLYYLSGLVADPATFDSIDPILYAPADTPFLGTTGFDPSNGAGQFEGTIVYLPIWGWATVQVRARYNGGGLYTSYDEALAAEQNVGESNPVEVYLPQGVPPTSNSRRYASLHRRNCS